MCLDPSDAETSSTARLGVPSMEVLNEMTTAALLIIGVSVALIILILASSRSVRGVPANLSALSDEARDRYLVEWDRIESRFVDAPEDAVRESDALVMSLLRERGHPLAEKKLPADVRRARNDASMDKGDRTEGMRRAILHYRAVVERMVGAPARTERDGRREMA